MKDFVSYEDLEAWRGNGAGLPVFMARPGCCSIIKMCFELRRSSRKDILSRQIRVIRPTLVFTAIAIQTLLCGCDKRDSGRGEYPSATPYREAADAARQEIIENDSLRIARLELGAEDADEFIFQASATNKTGSSFLLCLDLRSEPGLWYRKNWQKQFSFEIEPKENRQIEAVRRFLTLNRPP